MRIGNPDRCYFCEGAAGRVVSSSHFDLELECCERCGEAIAGLLGILASRGQTDGERRTGDSEERAVEYEAHADEFEERARSALSDLIGAYPDDEVLIYAVKAISSMATAETMARLIRLGKA